MRFVITRPRGRFRPILLFAIQLEARVTFLFIFATFFVPRFAILDRNLFALMLGRVFANSLRLQIAFLHISRFAVDFRTIFATFLILCFALFPLDFFANFSRLFGYNFFLGLVAPLALFDLLLSRDVLDGFLALFLREGIANVNRFFGALFVINQFALVVRFVFAIVDEFAVVIRDLKL